jgi:hypothetical protein
MSYDNLNSVSQNVLKLYQQLSGDERRIPFIFDDFHFCHSRVIGLDMTENRIFTLCHMITWVLFLRMFWNFISSLPVKRGGSLSFLVGTISNVLVMEIGWTDVGSGGYILVSSAHSNTSYIKNLFNRKNFYCLKNNWLPIFCHSHIWLLLINYYSQTGLNSHLELVVTYCKHPVLNPPSWLDLCVIMTQITRPTNNGQGRITLSYHFNSI